MPEKNQKERNLEWSCRILLTLHLLLAISGYIAYLQTRHQLMTPLIPEGAIHAIAKPYIYTALCTGGTFLAALWLYFFRKQTACIVTSAISGLAYKLLLFCFAA